ncbi:MAG: hypothetical protein NUV65_02525 [Candidatus Roizmanbacteria bacterium]|nr:hypothetical protein [Candidatus Roizmanbacteria bacterium]
MNKEVLIAIFIGIALGVGGALYINTQSHTSRTSVSGDKQIAEISVLPSPKVVQNAKYSGIPAAMSVVNDDTVSVKIEDPNGSIFVFQTALTIASSRHDKTFTQKITLKPGFNHLLFSAVGKNNTQNSMFDFFYLPVQKDQLTPTDETPKATSEAEVLKDKLEKKVLQLRYEAKKAIHGTVKNISDSAIQINTDSKTVSIKLEPEVTRFYEVDGVDLIDKEAKDVTIGDEVTVFISKLPDEEKSYTVYIDSLPSVIAGKIADIDTLAFRLTVFDLEQSKLLVDVENTTNQQAFNKESGKVEKYGFSKLQIGEQLFILASKNKDIYTATSYVLIPN